MLNLARLAVLRAVAEEGSFSLAAERLSFTQSAVSQSIARLEAETGAVLLVRDRRAVRPTAAGATLLEHAETIFAQVEAAEAELEAVLGVRGGRLRIASFPSAGSSLIPRAVSTFRSRHPEVSLSLAEGEPESLIPRIVDGEIDLALLFEFPDAGELWRGALYAAPLLEDPLDVVLPRSHPLARQATVRLTALQDEFWVQTSAESPCSRHIVRTCLSAGFAPKVSFESDDYQVVQGLVAAGVGVALIPRLALTWRRPEIVVRPLAPHPMVRRVLAAIPSGAAASPAARTMMGILEEVADASPPGPDDFTSGPGE